MAEIIVPPLWILKIPDRTGDRRGGYPRRYFLKI